MNRLIKDTGVALASIHKKEAFFVFLILFFITSCASVPHKTARAVKQKDQTKSAAHAPFRVGASTKLFISIYREPDLTGEFVVASDGTIDYGYAGNLNVKGLTLQQIEKNIEKLLERDYLVHPQVKVTVKEFGHVYVFGNVKNPGLIPLSKQLTALEAVVAAGGFSVGAERDWLEVVRMEKGQKRSYRLSLRAVDNGSLELPQVLPLFPDDTIIVR